MSHARRTSTTLSIDSSRRSVPPTPFLPSLASPSTPLDITLPSPTPSGTPPSAGALRTNFEAPPSAGHDIVSFPMSASAESFQQKTNHYAMNMPNSPRETLPHRRAPSVSFGTPASVSFMQTPPSPSGSSGPHFPPSSPFSATGKRHGRIHSRNLSVFFPRPENAASTSIPEDGGEAISPIQSSLSGSNTLAPPQRLGEGFRFGGRTMSDASSSMAGSNAAGATKRKGHHHKHSLSHNLFNFMDPSSPDPPNGSTEPPLQEASSPFLASTSSTPSLSALGVHASPSLYPTASSSRDDSLLSSIMPAYLQTSHGQQLAYAILEAILGASIWGAGQARGSLACTGLGYWVVFDASGVALTASRNSLNTETKSSDEKAEIRKPFGNRRRETTLAFSQAIYLLFSAVYVLKEAVEHFLLSSSEAEEGGGGHHHHRGDEGVHGISFPETLLWLGFASIIFSNLYYHAHARLVDATLSEPVSSQTPAGTPTTTTSSSSVVALRLPSALRHIVRRVFTNSTSSSSTKQNSLKRVVSNPFTRAPACFVLLLLYSVYFGEKSKHITYDMLIATLETVWTLSIAYPTAVALGTILLQTAPARRGITSSGPTEAFLRVMREIERHPHVLHLPAPHLWQLNLPAPSLSASSLSAPGGAELIATVELHVQPTLLDSDVLALTKWAVSKCETALGRQRAGCVTVSVVRG